MSAAFRRELGLAVVGPVVMSGHQAQFWHAGILSKALAMSAVRRAGLGAGVRVPGGRVSGAWVVVDQDASDSVTLAYPRSGAEDRAGAEDSASGSAMPVSAAWLMSSGGQDAELRADCAMGSLGAFAPTDVPSDAATPEVRRGLLAVREVLGRHAGAESAAAQVAGANAELLGSLIEPLGGGGGGLDGPLGRLVFASRLSQTGAMRWLLERMVADPVACVRAYNEAVAEVGRHDLAPLTCVPEKGRVELPLWQLSGAGKPGPRKRVFAHTLGNAPVASLSPRAIMMTALLRWLGCELFIHGTGGGASAAEGGYDRAAELWMRSWLGVRIAPSVVATGTLLLPLGHTPVASERDVLAAQHAAHGVRHAPGLLGDSAAQAAKDALVAQMRATSDRGERRALYLRMHAGLETYRQGHTAELAAARERGASLTSQVAGERVLHVRTWPWLLHSRARLLGLKRAMDGAFGLLGGAAEHGR